MCGGGVFCLSLDLFLVFGFDNRASHPLRVSEGMKVFIHLPDEVKDCVALAVSEGMVESPDQLVTCVDDRVDMKL
tara:strand:- start:80 stop:304 length:225 start_codon:yes stop_codon:yes gene_type:complete